MAEEAKAAKATKSASKPAKKKTTTAKRAAPKGGLRVRQVRSGLGHPHKLRRTLVALGLKYQHEVVVRDTPDMQGMLHKVRHLVRVTPEEA